MFEWTTAMVVLVAVSGCSNSANNPSRAEVEITSAVEKLYELESQCETLEANTIDAPDATSFGINAPFIIKKSDVRADAREDQLCLEGGRVEFGPDVAGVRLISDKVAIAHGVSTYREFGADESVVVDGAFNFTHVFQNTGEDWHIQHTHVGPLFPED